MRDLQNLAKYAFGGPVAPASSSSPSPRDHQARRRPGIGCRVVEVEGGTCSSTGTAQLTHHPTPRLRWLDTALLALPRGLASLLTWSHSD